MSYSVETEHGQAISEGLTLDQARRVAQENANATGDARYVVGNGLEYEEYLPEYEMDGAL